MLLEGTNFCPVILFTACGKGSYVGLIPSTLKGLTALPLCPAKHSSRSNKINSNRATSLQTKSPLPSKFNRPPNDQPISFATARFIIFSKPSYFLVAAFLSVFKAKGTNGFFRLLLTLIYVRLRGGDKLWRFGQGSARGTSKAKIL